MININQALLDPSSVFFKPRDVLGCDELSKKQKVEILKRWEYDARELEVADEENMGGIDPDILDEILEALHELHASGTWGEGAATKQG